MRFHTLTDWLAWQETLHPNAIDMGLERVAAVARSMGLDRPAPVVITVAGTNGKGSCVALLESILGAAGYRVGVYSSPHLVRYNERVRVCGRDAGDAALCAAFERIDQARGATSLTYFEFGTLAALDIFAQADLDVAVLEVGLGGRLDAVNIVAADAALITSVGIDHVEYLGPDRESIGREKAGILRPATPAVYGEADPPRSVLAQADHLAAPLHCLARDYRYRAADDSWDWRSNANSYTGLPLPNLPGAFQLQNAAAVLMVLELLAPRLPVAIEALHAGLRAVRLPGRFQVLPGQVEWILDVAHNPHAARALAEALRQRPCAGRTHLVLAMLADKDAAGVCAALRPAVAVWYCAGLVGPRGQSGAQLATRAGIAESEASVHDDVVSACAHAAATAKPGDRIVVCGSFHTVCEALQYKI
jgi:dihydrofolate synthase / folylpolyglutamate synthase